MEVSCTPLQAADGHCFDLRAWFPADPIAAVLWNPALGVAARHYGPFAEALAQHGVAVFVHEWRGHGGSRLRAGRQCDWGYRELLEYDLPASEAGVREALERRCVQDVPRIVGGHSLGGQLACCRIAMSPDFAERVWLVASGSPYWRVFPRPTRYALPLAYRFLPWLADACGALPGRRLGFGGQEARSVMRDWSRTALSGRYAVPGDGDSLEDAMARSKARVDAVVLAEDWLAPRSSLDFLLSKMGASRAHRVVPISSCSLGSRADHFAWMKQPAAVVEALLERS